MLQYFDGLDAPTYTVTVYMKLEKVESAAHGAGIEIYTSRARYIHSEFLTGSTDPQINGGFQKLTLTFTPEQGEEIINVAAGLYKAKGTVYVDSIQLEEGDTANAINLLSNSGFEKDSVGSSAPMYYIPGSNGAVTNAQASDGSQSFSVTGSPSQDICHYQIVYAGGKAGDVFSFGGWAKGDSVPTHNPDSGNFKIVAELACGTNIERAYAEFNPYISDWQFSMGTLVAKSDYSSVTFHICYCFNCNTAYFDSLFLYRDTVKSYTYDSNGNVISTKDNASRQSSFEYDGNNNLKKMLEPTGVSYEYTYDDKNNLTEAVSGNGIKYNITYDSYGNPLSTATSSTDGAGTDGTITSSATYQGNGNYPHTVTDSRGNTTTYAYDLVKGLQTSMTDAEGNTTGYSYYESNDRLKTAASGDSITSYEYRDFGGLYSITAPSGTTYGFTYDAFKRIQAVSVGTQKLSENFYQERKGPVAYSVYGNGTKIGYTYDILDRVTEKLYNDVVKVRFKYDKSGRLYEKQDLFTGTTLGYDYDLSGRVLEVRSSDGSSFHYTYDAFSRVSKLITGIGADTDKTEYIYGDSSTAGQKTGLLYGVKHNGIRKLGYAYDSLGRMKSRTLQTTAPFATEYTYLEGAAADTTTTLVKTVKNGDDTLAYAYDKNGNITSITKNGTLYESYTYDSLNQLKTVARGEDTWEYTYDNGGNLLSVSLNGTVIKTYGYGDANWKDKLTSYNGQELTYDEIGNPLIYRDGMSFTWQNGRQLAGISTAGPDGTSGSISYTYNAEGLRTSKTVNGRRTDYYVLEGVLLGRKTGNESIYFLYDENGSAYGFRIKNGTEEAYYYYEFNLQGDVTGILDASGTKVVEYAYEAWGDILSITGTMADTIGQKNPLRYRGYYYDDETGFYYLTSRYYDPEVCRFINADSAIGQMGSVQGLNMFAYALNNPIKYSDPTGNWPKLSTIFKGVAVAALAVAAVAVCVAAAPVIAGVTVASSVVATAAYVATAALLVTGVSTVAAVTSTVAEKAAGKTAKQNNSVYVLKDDTGTVQYVGRTNNVDKRAKAHSANPARAGLEMEVIATGLNLPESRALEQAGMAYYHTINTANKMNNQINSVSPKYWGAFKDLALGTLNYGWNQMSNEIMYWTGN